MQYLRNLIACSVLAALACGAHAAERSSTEAPAPSPKPMALPPSAQANVQSPSAISMPNSTDAVGVSPPLPPLPPSSASLSNRMVYVPPQPLPPSPCPADLGWEGRACVSRECPTGSRFKQGAGCVACLGECYPDPERSERAESGPWRDDPAQFERHTADERLSRVVLSSCKADGGPTGAGIALVTFRPSGDVGHVSLDAPFERTAVGNCIAKKLGEVRVPPFGGTSVRVSTVFSVQ